MRLLSQLTLSKGLLLSTFTGAVGLGWYSYAIQDSTMQDTISRLEVMRSVAAEMSEIQDAHSQILLNHAFARLPNIAESSQALDVQTDILDKKLGDLFVDSKHGQLLLEGYRESRAQMNRAEDGLFAALVEKSDVRETLLEFEQWKMAERASSTRLLDLEGYLTARLNDLIRESSEMTQKGLLTLAAIFGIGTLAIVLSHLYFYRHLVIPIENLEKALKELAKGDFKTRIHIKGDNELASLGQSFNRTAHQLSLMTDSLASSNESLKNFTAIVAHDLRSPLGSMIGFLDILKQKGLEEKRRDEMIGVVEKMARRTLRLLDTLLSYATAQSRRLEVVRLDAREEMKHVLLDLAEDIRAANGKVVLHDMPQLGADPIQFHELFRNLISNSLKYRRPDVPPEVNVRGFETKHDGQSVYRFEVEDNGIGFDDARQKELFQPFHRLDQQAKFKGTGLGLSICKMIVNRHHGSISARSQVGKGTVFTIEIPQDLKKIISIEEAV